MNDPDIALCRVVRTTPEDLIALSCVLVTCGLSSNGLNEGELYWMALLRGKVAGMIGIERNGSAGLLRSLAVMQANRGFGVARALVEHVLIEARKEGIDDLFLFNKDTGAFFEKLGWSRTVLSAVVARLPDAPQIVYYDRAGWYDDAKASVRSRVRAGQERPGGWFPSREDQA